MTTGPARSPQPIYVTIQPANPPATVLPTVDIDPVHVSKSKNQEVVWTCPQKT